MPEHAHNGKPGSPIGAGPGRPIALVGLMGVGKTVVGRLLGERLGRPFVDTDRVISRAAGRSITELFRIEGEPMFRERERALIAELPSYSGHVLALGGGMFVGEENVRRIHATATVVWLRARLATLASRLTPAACAERPLLSGADAMATLAALHAERAPWYARAHHAVDTDGREPEGVVDLIMAALGESCG